MENDFAIHLSELFTHRVPGFNVFVIINTALLCCCCAALFIQEIVNDYQSVYFRALDNIWFLIIRENSLEVNAPISILYFENYILKILHLYDLERIPYSLFVILQRCDLI